MAAKLPAEKRSANDTVVSYFANIHEDYSDPHLIPDVTSHVIYSQEANCKIHFPSPYNVIKDKEELTTGELVGYKEVDGVRTWGKTTSNGETTEKEPQGVFICPHGGYDQGDKTKFENIQGFAFWNIITGGATVNLSALRVKDEVILQMSPLHEGKELDFEYKITDDNLAILQQFIINTGVVVHNDRPNFHIPINEINEQKDS